MLDLPAWDPAKLGWKETRPGRFERDIDEAEQFYYYIARQYEGSGRRFFGMTGHVTLMVESEVEVNVDAAHMKLDRALQTAWLLLRLHHPNTASFVQYRDVSCKKIHRSFGSGIEGNSAKEQWLEDTFRVVRTDLSSSEWCNVDPPSPDLPTVFVLAPITQDRTTIQRHLVFRSPHEIIDGMGTLQLLNRLVALAAEAYSDRHFDVPAFGNEHTRLMPSFRVAAQLPEKLNDMQLKQLEQNIAANEAIAKNIEVATMPYKQGAQLPGVHKSTAITLNEDETSRLVAACKAVNATVTHAFHAAIAVVLGELQTRTQKSRRVRYINYCLINHRKDCAEPYNRASCPVSVIHSVSGRSLSVDLKVAGKDDGEAKNDFRAIMLHMRDFYHSIRDDKEHTVLAPHYWARGVPKLSEEVLLGKKVADVPAPSNQPTVSISSMGRIDEIIKPKQGAFAIHDPWITGEELRNGLGTFLGTWQGRLTFSAAYNDAWHEEKEVQDFLQRCWKAVCAGLGL